MLYGEVNIAGILASAVIGYFLGCISFAFLISRIWFKKDIRKYGSGNAGATNMMRTYGWQYGVLTFLGDAAKGAIACLIGKLLGGQMGEYVAAVCVIVGHIYPVFMKFRGGKGISTAAGVAFFLAPGCSGVVFAIAILLMIITRMVSVGSIAGVILIAVSSYIFYPDDLMFKLTTTLIALLCIYAHRANIGRIIGGTERKVRIDQKREYKQEKAEDKARKREEKAKKQS